MKRSLSLVLIAILAFGIGIAYAAPMLTIPNAQLYPRVFEGPKAKFSVDVVYANFNSTSNQKTSPFYNQDGTINHTETNPETDVNYNVVLNITNTADTPATLYQIMFAAAENVTVHKSILGGAMYASNSPSNVDTLGGYRHFGGVVEGVYLDGKWVNTTWIPSVYEEINGTSVQTPYPLCLYSITEASWNGGIISGPLTPENVAAFSANHRINGTIPALPTNASDTGIWFEGVPISEYYDSAGNPLLTMMYINGAWVDVTNRVTVDQTQPMLTTAGVIVNQVLPLGSSPYQNMNSTIGEITALPTWGDWGFGNAYRWFPWDTASPSFNNTFAPHESRLIMINNTQATANLAALESGNIVLYASASNYITNEPINGTYLNTVSTTTQIAQLHLDKTPDGYLYNKVLADNQTFQQINALEVKIAPRTEP